MLSDTLGRDKNWNKSPAFVVTIGVRFYLYTSVIGNGIPEKIKGHGNSKR